MKVLNSLFVLPVLAMTVCTGCVNGGHVVVTGGTEESLRGFVSGGGVEAIRAGGSSVRIGGRDVSSNVGADTVVVRGSSVKVGGSVAAVPQDLPGVSSGSSSVKVSGATITSPVETAVERISGTSRVVIADDSAEKDIRGGGLEVRPGMAVAVVPPPDAGTDEYRSAKKKAYIEILRQLKGRGCRLAARDMSSARFPVDMDKLEGYIMANGYDTGYNMALAESAAEAPSAELVIEVLDCQMDMVSGRSKVVVRMRSPLEYGGEMKSRSFRSKVPDKNICRAVSSLFAEK